MFVAGGVCLSESEEKEQWYTNKQLFEMLNQLKAELQETRDVVKKYNELRKTLNWSMERIYELEKWKSEREGRKEAAHDTWEMIRRWTPWVITIFAMLYAAIVGGGMP